MIRSPRRAFRIIVALTCLALVGGCVADVTPPPPAAASPSQTSVASSGAPSRAVRDRLRAALEATLAEGSAAVEMDIRFGSYYQWHGWCGTTAAGEFAFGEPRQASLHYEQRFDPAHPGVIARALALVVDGPLMWFRVDTGMGQFWPPATWVRVDDAGSWSADADTLRGSVAGLNDPSLVPYLLLGATGVGDVLDQETIRGIHTTHLASAVDFNLALERVPADLTRALAGLFGWGEHGVPTITAEAWVDGDDLVHRLRLVLDFPTFSRSVGVSASRYIVEGGQIVLVADFSNHGSPLHVALPDDAVVVPIDELWGPKTPSPSFVPTAPPSG